MTKPFLLLPLTAFLLSACSSSNHAPIENATGELTPGVMQPVSSNSTWEPQVQPSAMPENMNNQVVTQTVANQAGTYANTANTAVVTNTPSLQQVQQTAQPVTTTKTVCTPVKVTKQVANSGNQSQNIEIPRNSETNAPDYSKIDKGFYKGSSYTVKKGDTMFLIAYIAGMDVKELASLNGMSEPYKLSVGQTLKTANGSSTSTVTETKQECKEVTVTTQPEVSYTAAANGTQYGSDGTVTGPVKAAVGSAEQAVTGPVKATTATASTATTTTAGVVAGTATAGTVVASAGAASTSSAVAPQSNIAWKWPTTGKVVQGFSNADGGNKGIDISGSKGQAIYAAAAGRVVYAGNALRGYGNLIIIKHNDDFLSAYAHNDSISVSDQQQVKAGQQIAKMGSSGTNSVKLHFEIRYKGKSVDPTRYLPKR
ncbi:murein hydrolase activator NlpD [Lonepinella sp. BR2357]|uniref:murein hydrolase activator NlpD n=1 Tax=Lonepinella sp. BR2357 TaxID=3434549 RepID=UPI003F6E1FE2